MNDIDVAFIRHMNGDITMLNETETIKVLLKALREGYDDKWMYRNRCDELEKIILKERDEAKHTNTNTNK